MSPQTGLPHNNRVGDFDPFALPVLMQATGKSLETLLEELAEQSGLLGISGLSGDVRDLEEAAAKGHARADLALDAFVAAIRHYVGAYSDGAGRGRRDRVHRRHRREQPAGAQRRVPRHGVGRPSARSRAQ